MGRRSSSQAYGGKHPYQLREMKRQQMAGEPPAIWETAVIKRTRKLVKGQYEYDVKVIRQTK